MRMAKKEVNEPFFGVTLIDHLGKSLEHRFLKRRMMRMTPLKSLFKIFNGRGL